MNVKSGVKGIPNMLLIQDNDLFEVPIYFTQKDGRVAFYDNAEGVKVPEGAETETFVFRKPNWLDIRNINSAAMSLDGATTKPSIDMFRYMDLKVKTLLKDWTLKDANGAKVQVNVAAINKLHPDLVPHLFAKLEEYLTTK